MEHALAYVTRPGPDSCTWMIYCACLNQGMAGRDTDPIYGTGWIGGIEAHPVGSACSKVHSPAHLWKVRDVDATHVEFEPSINTQVGPDPRQHHFHTGNPTGPVEVRD